ncbi:hypothetical protein IEO21_07100 [Rhodonia placenta]|uniref:Uncharacterized protein n=1 Tax=Rhodonia placenta TaxID=104341 RepID=A0A8H7NYN2_9APHY|nr:hypothetical protein IEO21_07100 [Postia placenta]
MPARAKDVLPMLADTGVLPVCIERSMVGNNQGPLRVTDMQACVAEVFEAHRERRWDWKGPLRVIIEGDFEQRRPSLSHFAAFVSLLGIKWSDVQSLSIKRGSWHHTDFHPDVFTHLSVAPNNRHLALDDITLPSAVVFSNLITSLTHNFEGLRHYLSLCRIRLTALLDLPISWREGRRYPGPYISWRHHTPRTRCQGRKPALGAAGDSVLGVPLNSRASIEGRYRSVVEHGSGCDGCVLRVTQPSGNKGGASITEEMLKQLLPICRRIDRLLSRILVLFHVDVGVFLCPCTSLDLSIWYGATGDWFPGVQHRGVSIDRDPSWVAYNG